MKEEKVIDAKALISSFIAIGYLQEQIIFNLESLKEYILYRTNYDYDSLNSVFDEMDDVINQFINAKVIFKVDNYDNLYRISDRVDYRGILENVKDDLPDLVHFFYSYYDNKNANIKLSAKSQSKQKKYC